MSVAPEMQVVERVHAAQASIRGQLDRVIVGQQDAIEQLLIALFARGHCLLVGVPGLAKTLMIQTLAQSLGLSFQRIQFTPDLMPSDITGTEVLAEDRATGTREFRFVPGPVFAQVLLADEINRTPPKTQSALLEAMQEQQVTVFGRRHALPRPFFVLATQNPIEQEGTYPLPEAQLDRFLFRIDIDYPGEEDELEVIRRTTAGPSPAVEPVLSAADLLEMQELVREVVVGEHALRFALKLVRLTRRDDNGALPAVKDYVTWGAGPRAGQGLILGAKARALLHGRIHVMLDDIRAVALPALRHRVLTNFRAESEGVRPDHLIRTLLEDVEKTSPLR
jgi:MoxR-like ATPase